MMKSSLRIWWFSGLILIVYCGSSVADDEIEYQILPDKKFSTTRNETLEFEISINFMGTDEKCFLESPDKKIYQLHPFSNANLTISNMTTIHTKCGVRINGMRLDLQGNWTFKITTRKLGSTNFEHYQQTYKLQIEEYMDAIPSNDISTYVGEDVHIRLDLPIDVHSCITNRSNAITTHKVDGNRLCLFSLKDVSKEQTGDWVFGAIGDYTLLSKVAINLQEFPSIQDEKITLQYNFPTTLVMGPEEAIFCKAIDPREKEYTYNGQCSINIDRVSHNEAGQWKVYVGLNNAVNLISYTYNVVVLENSDAPSPNYIVESTELDDENKFLKIKCTLMAEMQRCRMIRIDGSIFIMDQGMGKGRYAYYGNGIYNDKKGNTISECGIQIEKPTAEDIGSWQCIIVTTNNTEFGKITFNPRAQKEENNPPPPPRKLNLTTHKGNTLQLLCNHNEKIDYCWFLSPNRTVYPSIEGFNHPEYENVGQGFALGECGIKIYNAKEEHKGIWKCNVGIANGTDRQQDIQVTVQDSLVVPFSKNYFISAKPTIGCKTYDESPVEYCRFIRPDGVGLNPSKTSGSYMSNTTDLKKGVCSLSLQHPIANDIGTWMCIAKPYEEKEYFDTINIYNDWFYYRRTSTGSILALMFYILLATALTFIIIALIVRSKIGKKYVRRVRESIRKQPLSSDI